MDDPLSEAGNLSTDWLLTGIEVREQEWLSITFGNSKRLIMSLKPDDYASPEAAVFYYRTKPPKVVVIQ
ncbi:MAG: hypothetical protein ACOY93_22315 [Bacillota bacterium]